MYAKISAHDNLYSVFAKLSTLISVHVFVFRFKNVLKGIISTVCRYRQVKGDKYGDISYDTLAITYESYISNVINLAE